MTAKAKKLNNAAFDLTTVPDVHYQKFFAKFEEIQHLDVSKWKSPHLIAHFCKKYEALYQTKYTFKFNASPSKCYEVYQLKRLAAMLNTADSQVIRDYIDWVFTNKIGTGQRRITVIGYLANQPMADEYKKLMKRAEQPTRASALPSHYLSAVQQNGVEHCATYGALAFLWMAHQADPDPKYEQLFQDLAGLGLNPAIFEVMK